MIFPPLPEDEEQRLAELLSYDILDTEAESLFDELTLLASQICDTPIALISLVDPQRQWFKSRVGLNATETSRNIAFCSHAILQQDIFEVQDASVDERFRDNPLVTDDPNIRFYAGAPLLTPSGHALGTLCAISDQPKQLTAGQKSALKTLGKAVMSHLELRRKNREQVRISKFKSDFLAYVSHEVRTPLNAINTFSALLEKEAKATQLPEPFPSYLSHISRSGERILTIVNSVLDVKQLESGEVEIASRTVNIQDFFTHLFALMRVKAEETHVQFKSFISNTLPATLSFDDTKVGQIALNILGNAIKYTPAGRKVSCRVSWRDNQLSMLVEDQGIGMSEESLTALFTPFKRMTNALHIEGTGLGLAITQRLIQLMGGSIDVQSKLNEGTRVSILLPVDDTAPIAEAATGSYHAEQASVLENLDVLVVEDNEINQIVARAVFEELGLPDINVVGTGEEAVEAVRNNPPDIIFMDINLPGIQGTEATEQIKAMHPDMPVVALTADVVTERETLLAHGLDDILSKPIDKFALRQALLNLTPPS